MFLKLNLKKMYEIKINHDLFRSRLKFDNNSCLVCYPKDEQTSIKETELGDFIKSLNVNTILNSRELIGGKEKLPRPFMPSLNFGIGLPF
jgi:hypothetical protein